MLPGKEGKVDHSTRNSLDPEIAAVAAVLLLVQSPPGPSDLQSELMLVPLDLCDLILDALDTLLDLCLGSEVCRGRWLDDPSQLSDKSLKVQSSLRELISPSL